MAGPSGADDSRIGWCGVDLDTTDTTVESSATGIYQVPSELAFVCRPKTRRPPADVAGVRRGVSFQAVASRKYVTGVGSSSGSSALLELRSPHTVVTTFVSVLTTFRAVQQQIEWWSTKAGVVGRALGDELYRELLGVTVCNATSSVQAVAQFWGCVTEFLLENTNHELQATASSLSSANEEGPTSGGREAEKVFFVVFPNCPELYDYKHMFTLVAAMEFAKESCRQLGKQLTLGIFHPHYKQSPNLMSPERHSPFPVVALQLNPGGSTAVTPPPPKDARPKRQRGNYIVRKPRTANEDDDDEDDEEAVQRAYGRIHNLDEQRNVLEVLFNSAAVPGSDAHPVGSPNRSTDRAVFGEVTTSTPEQVLSRSFRDEHQWRTRRLPDDAVRDMCQHWMAQHRFVDARHTLPNRALRFMDTVDPARWTISSSKVGEAVYAEVWAVIHELHELGRRAEQRLLASAAAVSHNTTAEDAHPSVADNAPPAAHQPFHHFVLRSLLSLPPVASVADKPPRRRPPVVLSSMVVSTKFCAFNAPAFKRFAISINAALKRLSQGRMFLEVFHNEYVGQDGFDHSLRRSPFPMIQICYEVSKPSKE